LRRINKNRDLIRGNHPAGRAPGSAILHAIFVRRKRIFFALNTLALPLKAVIRHGNGCGKSRESKKFTGFAGNDRASFTGF
jgi:hypothetical protein